MNTCVIIHLCSFFTTTMHNTFWTTSIEEDPTTGTLILTFPEDLLSQMKWVEGDTLTWTDMGNNSWKLEKAKHD